MAATVWLTRHGERIDKVDPTWARTAANPHNPPLTPLGVQQARATGARLRGAGITRVYTSPFLRCVETAHAIAEEIGGVPVHVEDGLGEFMNAAWFKARPHNVDLASLLALRRFPLLQSSDTSRVVARFPESISASVYRPDCNDCGICHDYREFPECDGTNHVHDRVHKAVQELVHAHENHGQHILLVGHGCSVEAAYLSLDPSAPHKFPRYCSVTRVVRAQASTAANDAIDCPTYWQVTELCTRNPLDVGTTRQ